MKKVLTTLLIASSLIVTSAFAVTFTCPTKSFLNQHKSAQQVKFDGVNFTVHNKEKIGYVSKFTAANTGNFAMPATCTYNGFGLMLTIGASNIKPDMTKSTQTWSAGTTCTNNAKGSLLSTACVMTGTPS